MNKIINIILISLVSSLAMANEPPNDPRRTRYIVKFVDGGAAPGKAALKAKNSNIALELAPQNAVAAYIPKQALNGLKNNKNIAYIEHDPPRYPTSQTPPYGISMVQADQTVVANGPIGNRTVCIIDSGYDSGHEDLSTATGSDTQLTWDIDMCGHGTHVAGTIAALDNTLGVVGVGQPNLHIVKVFGDDCSWTYASNLIGALNLCENAGADIVNMSLGCSGGPGGGPLACKSSTEEQAFDNAYANGILPIAAAGNDGNTKKSYPASYGSVISVAAIDENENIADFSQQNAQIELAAPGVLVRSTVPMGTGTEETLTVNGTNYVSIALEGSPVGSGSGSLVDCGLGTSDCPGGSNQICLIQRGEITFAEKVLACENGGGVAAIIYNNIAGGFAGTLGDTVTTIPSVSISDTDGNSLLSNELGNPANLTLAIGNYAFNDGTSMATPHVAGVAALVWSHNTAWTNQQIRDALSATAKDLGADGRDNAYGFGLVQAQAALDHLNGNMGNIPPQASFTVTCNASDCAFDASGSSDIDGHITSFAWEFGDGATETGISTATTHQYADGVYTAKLTVTDNEGAEGSSTQNITIGSPTSIFVTAMSCSAQGPHLNCFVTVENSSGTPESGASLAVELCEHPDGNCWFQNDTVITDDQGEAKYKLIRGASGNYRFEVLDITKSGRVYDSAQDSNNPYYYP